MLYGLLILILTSILSFALIGSLKRRYPFLDEHLLKRLFFYHLALAVVYYLYAFFNPSDSQYYFIKLSNHIRGENWSDHYGTSTAFIEFFGYPFVNFLGFSYEAMMFLFAFFGFVGFTYFYIFCRENIRFKHTFFGYDLLTIVFFLPNLHFWSSSFGKGAMIFMGMGMFFYGISNIRARWLTILFSGILIYHVRPHVMLMLLVSSAIGFVFTTKGISIALRVIFLMGVSVAFYIIYGDVLQMVGIDSDEFLSQGLDLSGRARELTKATSGIDINSYSLPFQVFTFLYRPLFVDAPGVLGLIVSFENVFYLLLTLRILSLNGINFLITSNFLVKTAFFSFLTVAVALAQISGNLGLAIRQKSQVMILFLFVIISFLDKQKLKAYQQAMWQRARKARAAALEEKSKAI